MADNTSKSTQAAQAKASEAKATEADTKAAEKEGEEAKQESLDRTASITTSTATAAFPVDDTAVSQPPAVQPSTHVDKDGVERITSGTDIDGWVPAPTEAHPSQVKAADKRNERFEAEAKQRQETLKKASA